MEIAKFLTLSTGPETYQRYRGYYVYQWEQGQSFHVWAGDDYLGTHGKSLEEVKSVIDQWLDAR